ncbi:CAP Gly-rich domain-containing protein [Protomyces lactucae-debilis]|uniref:CAP Gly-rich domain-containing protein n=1 Tax=Protomyces lactucae-debilis TaxID=2754530 RepID=A0A1Y2EU39_PROLT|nr:CAP Gly-rich domain-containing protein [Protomyces lactucae-debilis]ORY75080.1 CAP Gly-rich domain-containing protein [Protomyces lactucae-debilis]
MADIAVFVESPDTSSERRISPGWTIATLKQKLWPIVGIPPSSQIIANAADDDLVSTLGLQPLSVLKIGDARPPGMRENYTDDSKVDKFEMPLEQYEQRDDTVLAYKKRHGIGRFDPDADSKAQDKEAQEEAELARLQQSHPIGSRCQVEGESTRRGSIQYVGRVPEIPAGGIWIGIAYDEPVGKHDGTIQGKRYFDSGPSCGSFLRPGKVIAGDFPPLDDGLMSDDEM